MSFPLGCSLCRSEKLELIERNEKASNGVNLESRQDMKERFDHVLGHEMEREIFETEKLEFEITVIFKVSQSHNLQTNRKRSRTLSSLIKTRTY